VPEYIKTKPHKKSSRHSKRTQLSFSLRRKNRLKQKYKQNIKQTTIHSNEINIKSSKEEEMTRSKEIKRHVTSTTNCLHIQEDITAPIPAHQRPRTPLLPPNSFNQQIKNSRHYPHQYNTTQQTPNRITELTLDTPHTAPLQSNPIQYKLPISLSSLKLIKPEKNSVNKKTQRKKCAFGYWVWCERVGEC